VTNRNLPIADWCNRAVPPRLACNRYCGNHGRRLPRRCLNDSGRYRCSKIVAVKPVLHFRVPTCVRSCGILHSLNPRYRHLVFRAFVYNGYCGCFVTVRVPGVRRLLRWLTSEHLLPCVHDQIAVRGGLETILCRYAVCLAYACFRLPIALTFLPQRRTDATVRSTAYELRLWAPAGAAAKSCINVSTAACQYLIQFVIIANSFHWATDILFIAV